MKYVKTSQAVDATLNQLASELNQKPSYYVFYFNDCGTFANWIWVARDAEGSYENANPLYPYFPASTGGINYINNFSASEAALDEPLTF